MPTTYERVEEVSDKHNGLQVKIALNKRFKQGYNPYHTISIRTFYPNAPTQNRRFYNLWNTSLNFIFNLMNTADQNGLFNNKFDDNYQRHNGGSPLILADKLANNKILFNELTIPDERKQWGKDTIYVIGFEPPGTQWRKVMIASKMQDKATFRSLTTNGDYKPRIIIPDSEWDMDNAMIDCDPLIFRNFHKALKNYI